MAARTIFITGTDTGVGKTVLTTLLVRRLRAGGVRVCASKPICSGGREDAKALHTALGKVVTLGEINPWHFRAPLAPLLAARRERRRVRLEEVLAHLRRLRSGCDMLLIEGAGGLLSPLGENFNARDLISALRAAPLIVCPNRLGAINQALLVRAALPPSAAQRSEVVLMSPRKPDAASRANAALLAGLLGEPRVHSLPWLAANVRDGHGSVPRSVRRTLDAVMAA